MCYYKDTEKQSIAKTKSYTKLTKKKAAVEKGIKRKRITTAKGGRPMIYGHIDAPSGSRAYPEPIERAIAYCREAEIDDWKEGRYELDGDRWIAQVFSRETGPKEEKLPEVHRRYIELQFMAEGREYIGYYPDCGGSRVREDRLKEKDTLYYEEDPGASEIMLPMEAGCYAVFFPEDVHRPFCQMGEAQVVKRIVIKIDVDSI